MVTAGNHPGTVVNVRCGQAKLGFLTLGDRWYR